MDDIEYRIVNMTIYRCCEKVGDNLRHYLWKHITPKCPSFTYVNPFNMGEFENVTRSIQDELHKYKF